MQDLEKRVKTATAQWFRDLRTTHGSEAEYDLCAAFGITFSSGEPAAMEQYVRDVQHETQYPASPAYRIAAHNALQRIYAAFPEYRTVNDQKQ